MAFKLHTIYKQKRNSDGNHWFYYYKEGRSGEKWKIGVNDHEALGADHSNSWTRTEPEKPETIYGTPKIIDDDKARYQFIDAIFQYVGKEK